MMTILLYLDESWWNGEKEINSTFNFCWTSCVKDLLAPYHTSLRETFYTSFKKSLLKKLCESTRTFLMNLSFKQLPHLSLFIFLAIIKFYLSNSKLSL